MKVGVRVPASAPISHIVGLARRAEAVGLSHVWFPDSHLNYREVWTVLGAVAVSTDTIGVSPSVTNLATRHPSVTASAARSLTELCGDRFILGIGAGDSAIGHSGLTYSRTSELRAGLMNLRAWMSGAPVGDGQVGLRHRGAVPPIFLAASGPRNLQLGGELADGVVISLPRLAEKRALVAGAAATAGRSDRVEVAVVAMSLIMADLEQEAMRLGPFVIRTAQVDGTGIFDEAGVTVKVPEHHVGAAGDLGHPASLTDAVAVASKFVSPEAAVWYARNCTVSGAPADMLSTLQRLADSRVDRVTLSLPVGTPEELIDLLGSEVLPKLTHGG